LIAAGEWAVAGVTRQNGRIGIDKKLARYALAGSAILGAPLAARADTIIFSGLLDESISSGGPTVNLPGGASFTLSCCIFPGGVPAGHVGASAVTVSGANAAFVASGGYPEALSSGALITTANAVGPGGILTGQASYKSCSECLGWDYYGHWNGTSFLGFSFDDGGDFYTGWAQIAASSDAFYGTSGTLVEYAYNSTPGDPINAGEVPEPSSLLLFALGAAGIAALRKRRKAAN